MIIVCVNIFTQENEEYFGKKNRYDASQDNAKEYVDIPFHIHNFSEATNGVSVASFRFDITKEARLHIREGKTKRKPL
jgi:hypothetical protein